TSTGSIPGTLQLAIESASLAPRVEPYLNNVDVIPNNGSATVRIPVRLTVSAGANLQATPTTLTFTYQTGAANPATQTINLTSSAAAIAFSATAASTTGGNWLSVSPASGTTTAVGGAVTPLTVTANPGTLAAGTYNGAVTITPTTAGSQPVTVNVTLTVTSPAPPSGLAITNNASSISRGVSPGQIITIKGRNLAPATGLSGSVQNNSFPTRLGEVRVLFDSVEAPLFYVGPSGDRTSDQINAIVPYGVSGRASTNLVVEYRGVPSQPLSLSVRETDPGIFTVNQQGSGAASLLNQNNSANTQANPAVAGSVIQIFGTGEGLVAPNPGDGRVVPVTAPFPAFLNAVQVRVNGRVARVVYSGSAPGLVAGVFQINVELPVDLGIAAAGQVPLEVQIGSTASQPSVTLWARPRP
ncbi:MAG: hypothetical protein H7039_11765, partial [Bryobacteraceae bacterium]|nr:hypothetical protein [Bryobacteraceae bacterium]